MDKTDKTDINKALRAEGFKMCAYTHMVFPETDDYFYTRELGGKVYLQPHSKFSKTAAGRVVIQKVLKKELTY